MTKPENHSPQKKIPAGTWITKNPQISIPLGKLTVCTWKWRVGRLVSFLGWPIFRCYVSFGECKCSICWGHVLLLKFSHIDVSADSGYAKRKWPRTRGTKERQHFAKLFQFSVGLWVFCKRIVAVYRVPLVKLLFTVAYTYKYIILQHETWKRKFFQRVSPTVILFEGLQVELQRKSMVNTSVDWGWSFQI